MLSVGIPKSVVLDRIQEQYYPTKRLSHTVRQDLNNVCRDFNINEASHKDDALSMDIIVHKMMDEDYNPILVYKFLGKKIG